MKKFSNAKERFIYFLDLKGDSRNKFYSKSGMSNGLLDKTGGLSEDSILKICEVYPEISLDWLLLEKGNIIKKEVEKSVAVASAPQSNASNGDMSIQAPAELLQLLTSQQQTINNLSEIIKTLAAKDHATNI